jgi:hypothetical protein
MKNYSEMRSQYEDLLKSGMFWEFYPELSGQWVKDKFAWKKIYRKNKAYRDSLKK